MYLEEEEQAELYKCEIANILSNTFLSDLSSCLRNCFHSCSSSTEAESKRWYCPTHFFLA